MGKIYQVIVNGLRGEKMTIDLCNTEEQMKSMTVEQLRKKIEERLPMDAGDNTVRLIFTDKALDDDSKLLSEYGIQHMSFIQLVIKISGGGGPRPEPGAGGMGDKDGKNLSMERLDDFRCPLQQFQKKSSK